MTVHEDPVLVQLYARAKAPCRDYYGLTITENWVVLNIWNISHGPHVFPKRYKSQLVDFTDEKYLQEQVGRIFGIYALQYALGLSRKERNLQYLPTKLFLYILRYLATNDILHLSQTSKIFFDLCNNNEVWRIIYRKKLKKRPTYEDNRMAQDNVGWKEILRKKFVKNITRMKLDATEMLTKPSRSSLQALNQSKKQPNPIKTHNSSSPGLNQFSSSTTAILRNKLNVKPKDTSKSYSNLITNKPVRGEMFTRNIITSTIDIIKGKGDSNTTLPRNKPNATVMAANKSKMIGSSTKTTVNNTTNIHDLDKLSKKQSHPNQNSDKRSHPNANQNKDKTIKKVSEVCTNNKKLVNTSVVANNYAALKQTISQRVKSSVTKKE